MSEMNASAEQGLEPVTSLEAFFHESMDSAIAANRVTIDAQTAHYVVNLLTQFSRSESFYEATPDGPQLKPLAGMYAEAAEAPTDIERNTTLQRMGDVALFMAGFFADGLQHRAVDVDYYVTRPFHQEFPWPPSEDTSTCRDGCNPLLSRSCVPK